MAKADSPIFVGYSTLEGWAAAAADKRQPVQASALQVTVSSASSPVETRRQVIMVSQISGGTVNYCRFTTGYIQLFNGQPWSPDFDQSRLAHRDVYEMVVAWLEEQGYKVVDATVSHPKGLELVDGDVGFLEYDKASGTWSRKG